MDEDFASASATEICRKLIELWKGRVDGETRFQQRGERPNLAKFLSVYGLAAHTYRVGEQALEMYESKLVLEAFPLLRLTYESALTAHWIAQNVDGGEAFLNRDIQSRKAAAETLRSARSEILSKGADNFPGADRDLLRTSSQPQAKYFEQLCKDLDPGGADAYAYYRLMSWYAHPTARIVDKYLQSSDDGQELDSLRQIPEQDDPNIWVHFLAYSMVWAARAVDFIDAERTHRSELRAAASALGIPAVLKLSEDARRRTRQAQQAWRQENWRGPRKRD